MRRVTHRRGMSATGFPFHGIFAERFVPRGSLAPLLAKIMRRHESYSSESRSSVWIFPFNIKWNKRYRIRPEMI